MNTQNTTSLQTKAIDVTASKGPKLGTWSYANMYEALYNKFSQYKNFNINMWRDAIKLGEQDQYLAFLEQNKDTQMSKYFYDDEYYDYERMMLEMYLPMANKTNNDQERFTSVIDPVSNEWIQQSVGKMSDYDWISHQLKEAYAAKDAQIEYQLEADRKESMSWLSKVGHTALATGWELGEGVVSGVAGFLDFFGSLAYASYQGISNGEGWADAYIDYYAEKGLLAAEREDIRARLDEYERTHTYFRDIDGNITGWGKYLGGVANSIGMMIPSILANFAGGPTGVLTFYSSLYSSNINENATNQDRADSSAWLQIGNAALKSAGEAVIEYGLGRILGSTTSDRLIGMNSTKKTLKEGATRVLSQQTVKKITQWTGFKTLLKEAGQEGLEEFLQDFSSNCIDQWADLTHEGYGNTGVTFQTLVDSFIAGVLSSMIMSHAHIGAGAIASSVKNHSEDAKKNGTRPGDIYVETEAGPQKITGYNRLWFSELVSTFNLNAKKLSKAKFNLSKNMSMAEETFAAFNALAQYYSQLDEQRVKNIELLLNRVVNAEQNERTAFEQQYSRAASILSEETISKIIAKDVDVKSTISAQVPARRLAFALKGQVEDMIGVVGRKVLDAAKKAIEDEEEKLKEGGVTDTKYALNLDGKLYRKNNDFEEIEKLEQVLTKPVVNRLKEFIKDYEWVFVTDGHTAAENGNILFVSEGWLKNYETSDIYKFLARSKVIDTLVNFKEYQPMWKKVTAFYQEITGQKDAKTEEAIFHLLFNKEVYQRFLLSQDAKYAHEFKDFIFHLYDTVNGLIDISKGVMWRGKVSEKRVVIANEIRNKMKLAMCEPIMKAIINWGFDEQEVRALSVLTDTKRDLEFIQAYKQHKEVFAQLLNGKMTSAHRNFAEDIMQKGKFTAREVEVIEIGLSDSATFEQRLLAIALLDEADRGMTTFDFEYSKEYSRCHQLIINLSGLAIYYQERFMNYRENHSSDTEALLRKLNDDMLSHYDNLLSALEEVSKMDIYIDNRNLIMDYAQKMRDNIVYKDGKRVTTVFKIGQDSGLTAIEANVITLIQEAAETLPPETHNKENGVFTIPYEAIPLDTPEDHSAAQFVSDVLNEFKRRYGISARQMMFGDLRGASLTQRNSLMEDMYLFGVGEDDYVRFVILKLENMLGDEYVVTPRGEQRHGVDIDAEDVDEIRGEALSTEAFFKDILRDIKTISNEDAQNLLGNFEEITRNLRAVNLGNNLGEFSEEVSMFFDTLFQHHREDGSMNTLKWLLSNKFRVMRMFSKTVSLLNENASSTGISYFSIAKKIPANKLLYSELVEADADERNEIFLRLIHSNSEQQYDDYDVTFEGSVKLSTLMDLSQFSTEIQEKLEKISVVIKDAGPNRGGYWSRYDNEIVIDPNKSGDYINTLVHEVNHALQTLFDLPQGFSPDRANLMPDFLIHVANNYRDYFLYALRTRNFSYPNRIERLAKEKHIRLADLYDSEKKMLAHCAYMLVQGEIWARAYSHNKRVHGFVEIDTENGNYILAPDGKTKFKRERKVQSTNSTPQASSELVESALYVTMMNVLEAKRSGDVYTTNTYHTRLSKDDVPVLRSLIDESKLRWFFLRMPTINDIIKTPELLSKDIIAEYIGDDLSEGNIASGLKLYIEDNFPGISIDKTANTHRYVLVDDNAYDDLILHSVQDAMEKNHTSLYEKYNSKDGVSLSKFYKSTELKRLGVGDDVKVVINPNVNTEVVFDKGSEQGIIYIRANKEITDAKIMHRINHEFRHLMQRYNLLETGFTPDFRVTQEMIADVKKHVPELFKDQSLKSWATVDAKNKNQSWEASIVQQFVYTLNGGELNAYGISSSLIRSKTLYVTYEAGKPTIFMPWYDAQSGEGRHRTDYIASRGDDDLSIPVTKRKGIPAENMPRQERKEKDTRPRGFSHKKAKGTNLEYFEKKGTRNQLDPRLQDFVIATTGYDDRLPPALKASIHRGDLNMQAFKKWFRQAKDIDDFTFQLINKYIFKNEYINSIEELDAFLGWQPQVYWSLNVILLRKGASLQTLVTENDLDNFMHFMQSAENSKLWNEVLKLSKNFDNYPVEKKDSDKITYEHIGVDETLHSYMRVYAMEHFDGTLAGAFSTANAFRKTLFRQEAERRNPGKFFSLDQTLNNAHSDDKAITAADKISEADVVNEELTRYGNDILAIYEGLRSDKDDAIEVILHTKYVHDVNELIESLKMSEAAKRDIRKKLNNIEKLQDDINELEKKDNLTDAENMRLKNYIFVLRKYRQLIEDRPTLRKAFMDMSPKEIASRVLMIKDAETMGRQVDPAVYDAEISFSHEYSEAARLEIAQGENSKNRVNIVARIKGRAKTLINFVQRKILAFEDLPEEVREMFEYTTDGKSVNLKLKPEVYYVGRGRAKLPGLTDTSRKDYTPKHEILRGNEAYRHSVEDLLYNERLLVATVEQIKQDNQKKKAEIKTVENAHKTAQRKVERLEQQNRELRRDLKNATKEIKRTNSVRQIEVRAERKKTSDTPNNFQIISSIEMPEVLYGIYDVSFNEMADTRVQFVSKDKDGKYYDKETMKPQDFDGIVKHEVANWDAFYEAARSKLLSLTRNDVLDIIEFIELGVSTLGPSNKLSAFNIFLLGYFLDAARENTFDWNFSASQISHLETLFENKASEAGVVLNSVKQMKDVIDPLKRVRQRMFEDWITMNDTEKDKLEKEVAALQKDLRDEKDVETLKKKTSALSKKLKTIQKNEFEAREKSTIKFWEKRFWNKDNFSKLYQEVKSFRYLSMLSSPLTWIRNKISNAVTFVLNRSADVLAKIIFKVFPPRAYRKEQWDLSNVKISQEVKNFIDKYIKKNPIFNILYDTSGKYDERQRKKINNEKELFVSLITSAIEQKYAANHRFDRNTFNYISRFVNFMMSDRFFIKLASGRYFGKILTLEVEKGNVDLSEGLGDKALNLFAEAVILANQEYMHKRSFLADSIDKLAGEHPYLYETVNFFQPFLNSSFNWFVEMLKYTPLGLISSIYRMTKLEQQIDKIESLRKDGRELVVDSRVTQFLIRRDIGKGTVGLLLSMLGLWLGLNGILDFEEDDEKFYVIAGDYKVDISNISASSSVLIGASIAQCWIKQSDGEVASLEDMLDMTVGYMLDGFFINDILERHRWNTGIYDGILTETESILRSFVPQIWQLTIRSFNNEKIKYSAGMKGMWERWLNSWVPTQPAGDRVINPYTGKVQTKYALPILGELLKGGFLGPRVYWYEIEAEEALCREYEVNKNELTGELTVNNKKYSIDKEQLNLYYGNLNQRSLAKIKSQKHTIEMPNGKFKTLSWDQMSDEQRKRVLNRTMTQNAEIAKIYLWTKAGHKYYASDSMWTTLKKLGITQNVYKGDKGFVE